MNFFLTSCGLTNDTLVEGFCSVVPKPISKVKVAFIPTAANPCPDKSWMYKNIENLKRAGVNTIEQVDISKLSRDEWSPLCSQSDVLGINSRMATPSINLM